MCRSQIPVCVLNVFSLFSNTAVLGESTCIENRLSLIDQSNLCNTWEKKEKGEEGKKKSTSKCLQVRTTNIKRRERTLRGEVIFRCLCTSAEEIKVDKTRDGRKESWREECGRKQGNGKLRERMKRGKMDSIVALSRG